MEQAVQQESVTVESEILNEEQLQAVVEGKELPKDGQDTTLPSEATEEELIAGKFKSQEDLLKAYQELESKLGTTEPEAEPTKETTEGKDEFGFDKAVVDEYTNKFNANGGKLTDEDYAELAKKGYPKEQVDLYIEGSIARQQKKAVEVISNFGTVQDFQAAVQWAQQNWSEDKVTAYNKALQDVGDNTEAAKFIVGNLMNEYKSNTSGPIHSNTAPKVEKPKGYSTKAEMQKDMQDPRYGRDIAYSKKVEAKMAETDTASWYR